LRLVRLNGKGVIVTADLGLNRIDVSVEDDIVVDAPLVHDFSTRGYGSLLGVGRHGSCHLRARTGRHKANQRPLTAACSERPRTSDLGVEVSTSATPPAGLARR
jgi:hypothetical protein